MNLKLITTETFVTLPCNFYRNANNEILLTREQVGQALEYKNPIKAIQKIHLTHQDRLEPLCLRIKSGHHQSGGVLSKSEEQERVYYTQRGIMELCRWSRQPKADLFMDWVWDIVEKYRNNELISVNQLLSKISDLSEKVSSLQQDLSDMKTQLPKKRYSYWSGKMYPKYQLLADYFGITHKELYRNLFEELKALYPDIDLNQIIDDYCYENKIDSCYTLEAIEHTIPVRQKFEKLVDTLLKKYNLLPEDSVVIRPKTIFHAEEV